MKNFSDLFERKTDHFSASYKEDILKVILRVNAIAIYFAFLWDDKFDLYVVAKSVSSDAGFFEDIS